MQICDHPCSACQSRCHRQNTSAATKKDALAKLALAADFSLGVEQIPLAESLHRVIAQDVLAVWDSPVADYATHDGIAIVREEAGASVSALLPADRFQIVGMGNVIPGPFDTVLAYELCSLQSDGSVRLLGLSEKGEGIIRRASGIRKGELVLGKGLLLEPRHLAILRYSGIEQVSVYCRPTAAIIPVGSDLTLPGITPAPGQYPEADGILVESVIRLCGGTARLRPPVQDDMAALKGAVQSELTTCDMVVLIGGVGLGGEGYRDFSRAAVEDLGSVLVHGLSFGPGGKAALLGVIDNKPVIGIPGPPHAAILVTEELIPPIMELFLDIPCYERPVITAEAGVDISAKRTSDFFPRVRLSSDDGRYIANPVRMGDNIETFARAEGIARYRRGMEYPKGSPVEVELLYSERQLSRQLKKE
ncbi:molybdopterin-binding protein [Desulfitobacterium hafniense]|uniref:molybdopterin-binding protein n=1 Tax=Desulfitobacterium hafniense TaxID=49338 RepID=UPI00030A77D8|nr:molybdopterin-binding protein [Desulfitobacterium hafniense]